MTTVIREIPGVVSFSDRRNSLKKHASRRYNRRSLAQIKHIAIHHSATTTGSAESYANYHVNTHGWPGIGYHFIVERDGMVKWCNDLETVSYHVGNANTRSVGICMTGNFATSQKPTKEQYQSVYALVRYLQKLLNININEVKGHNEISGYSWTVCPAINMAEFRRNVQNAKVVDTPVVTPPPAGSNPEWYVVQQGDTLWRIAHNHEGVSVADLKAWNNLKSDTITVGQRLRMKKPTTSTPAPTPKPAPVKSFPLPNKVLRRGDKGNDVLQVQRALDELWFLVGSGKGQGLDGIYGANTENAVRRFQSMYWNLANDGIYGSNTRARMLERLADNGK